MAGNSPRRSVRSRTTQPTAGSHHSSASSNSSSRADRNTRTSVKAESPRKSTPSGSLSSEPTEFAASSTFDDGLATRRRRRGQADEQDEIVKKQTGHARFDGDDLVEDDEAVRCICGLDDYPGPPQLTDEDKKLIGQSIELDLITAADYTEDLAGFFLQCDVCKVWQHGGCVGIKNEDMSPDEYFCELCRSDLHRVFTASNGQKYSQYLPLHPSLSRTTSRAASFSKDGTKSPKGSRSGRTLTAQQSAAKRRSTMNSRDAAYDEEEQLRQAIEASKGEKSGESTDGATRRTKRSRSDSEEKPESAKRQRTNSPSPTPPPELGRAASLNDFDEDAKNRNGAGKKIRGAAARNHREKEMREERERIRAEAANKRKGRAERRRIEDLEALEDVQPNTRSTTSRPSDTQTQAEPQPPPSSQPAAPDTPELTNAMAVASNSKKGSRPPQARKGKVGRNQYTKDRDPNNEEGSPNRSQSRDGSRADDSHQRTTNGDTKAPRSKTNGGSKVTFSDMKRKVAWMLDFISKTQLDMASATTTSTSTNGTISSSTENLLRGLAGGLVPMLKESAAHNGKSPGAIDGDTEFENGFRDLKLLEMMDVLTRMLVKWQKQYA